MGFSKNFLNEVDPQTGFLDISMAEMLIMDFLKNREGGKEKIERHRIQILGKLSCCIYIQVGKNDYIKEVQQKADKVKEDVTKDTDIKISVHVICKNECDKISMN